MATAWGDPINVVGNRGWQADFGMRMELDRSRFGNPSLDNLYEAGSQLDRQEEGVAWYRWLAHKLDTVIGVVSNPLEGIKKIIKEAKGREYDEKYDGPISTLVDLISDPEAFGKKLGLIPQEYKHSPNYVLGGGTGSNTPVGPNQITDNEEKPDIGGTAFEGWENGNVNANETGPVNQVIPVFNADGDLETITVVGLRDKVIHHLTPDDLFMIGVRGLDQLENFDFNSIDPQDSTVTPPVDEDSDPSDEDDLEEIVVTGNKPPEDNVVIPRVPDTVDFNIPGLQPPPAEEDKEDDTPGIPSFPQNPKPGDPLGNDGAGGGAGGLPLPEGPNYPSIPTPAQAFSFFSMPEFKLLPNDFGRDINKAFQDAPSEESEKDTP